ADSPHASDPDPEPACRRAPDHQPGPPARPGSLSAPRSADRGRPEWAGGRWSPVPWRRPGGPAVPSLPAAAAVSSPSASSGAVPCGLTRPLGAAGQTPGGRSQPPNRGSNVMHANDLFETITNQLIADIESGAA